MEKVVFLNELTTVIIPFFKKHPLKTSKQANFVRFVQIIERMERGEHLTQSGFSAIAEIVGKKLS